MASISESVLKRDRSIILVALAGVVALAWADMVRQARAMNLTAVCHCAGMTLSGPDARPWSIAVLLALFVMWAEMMVAMMVPSATPMVLTFAMVNRRRREQDRPFVHTVVFLSGYLLVWTLFSAAVAALQWSLHAKALMSPSMTATSTLLGAALLIAAGLFQWTRFKNTCLARCSSPMDFLMTQWRDGTLGAVWMGIRQGVYCTGCCWLLMLILFIAGVMNITWIAIITVFVLVEKAMPRSRWIGRTAGVGLIAWGVYLLIRTALPA